MRLFDGFIITSVSILVLSTILLSKCLAQSISLETPSTTASAFPSHGLDSIKVKGNCFKDGLCFVTPVSSLKVCLPGSQTAFVNEYHSFKCQFNSNITDVQLLFNNKKVLPSGIELKRDLCALNVIFPSLGDCHNGIFTCVASNIKTGEQVRKNLSMHAVGQSLSMPIISPSKDIQLTISTTAYISCIFPRFANRRVNYDLKWKNPFGFIKKIVNGTDGFNIFHSMKDWNFKVTIKIENVTKVHGTSYFCSITTRDSCNTREIQRDFTVGNCPAGSYCDYDYMYPVPCREGTYNPDVGKFTKGSCQQCPIGSYCPKGSKEPRFCGKVIYRPIENYLLSKPMHGLTELAYKPVSSASSLVVAKDKSDCQRCPLTTSCENDNRCHFVCANEPTQLVALQGQSITLHCQISNKFLMQSFYWLKDGKTLQDDSHYKIIVGSNYSELIITDGSKANSGEYSCFGTENYMGTSSSRTFQVRFEDAKSHKQKKMVFMTSGLGTLAIIVILGIIIMRYFICKATHQRFRKRNSITNAIINDQLVEEFEVCGLERGYFQHDIVTRNHCVVQEENHSFDVFICYSSIDRIWVKDTLLKQLEALEIKACIDFRDFAIGETIIQNISDAIRYSKKTIAILSPDFLQSEFCKHELQSALRRKNEHEVIPILYRKCDVPELLKHKTYLDWDHCDVKPYFWNQLLDAITWEPS